MIASDLAVAPSTARRWVLIANHSIISNRAHAHALPSFWMTLYGSQSWTIRS
jgi:hypothetical protein